jgi:hypothetical protein
MAVRRENGSAVFDLIRIKLDGEDYRHQTSLGARKPAHSSAGGGGGGSGTPRK